VTPARPRHPLQVCHACRRAAGLPGCSGPCPCPADGADIRTHARTGCPLGLFGGGPLPGPDLTGYDPDTSPDSPRVGSCCGPPRQR